MKMNKHLFIYIYIPQTQHTKLTTTSYSENYNSTSHNSQAERELTSPKKTR